jgi:hypothetical protein
MSEVALVVRTAIRMVVDSPSRALTNRRERRIAAGLSAGEPGALERLHEAFGQIVFRHLLRPAR